MTPNSGPGKISILSNTFGLAAILCLTASLSAQAPPERFFGEDAPHAGTQSGQGSFPSCINQIGFIAGWYIDASNTVHAYFVLIGGDIVEFDAPTLGETIPTAISVTNRIVGIGVRDGHNHGWARSVNGRFLAIDAPGATDTLPYAINDNGQIAGYFKTPDLVWHGFVRDPNGAYTVLDAPQAGTGREQGTFANAIGGTGVISGRYIDSLGVNHGFIRDTSGNYTSYDAPGAGTQDTAGTFPGAMNSSGAVIGTYVDAGFNSHSFERDSLGNIRPIDFPGAANTYAQGINDFDAVVGIIGKGSLSGSFRRDGFDVFGPLILNIEHTSSSAVAVTNQSRIIGFYVDANGVYHGFQKRVQT